MSEFALLPHLPPRVGDRIQLTIISILWRRDLVSVRFHSVAVGLLVGSFFSIANPTQSFQEPLAMVLGGANDSFCYCESQLAAV